VKTVLILIAAFGLSASAQVAFLPSFQSPSLGPNILVPGKYLSFAGYTNYPGLMLAVTPYGLVGNNGDAVTNWTGLGTSLTNSSANAPIVATRDNGYKAAKFQGTSYLKFPSSSVMNSNLTVFIVLEATNSWGLGDKYLLSGASSALWWGNAVSQGNRLSLAPLDGGGLGINYCTLTYPPTLSATATTTLYCQWKYGATNVPERVLVGVNKTVQAYTWTNGVLSWPLSGQTYIGTASWSPGSDNGIYGWIHEIAIFTNALPVNSIGEIAAYLTAKYSTGDLGYLYADGDMGFIGGAMEANAKIYAPVFTLFNNSLLPHNSGIAASTVRLLTDIQVTATNRETGVLALYNYPGIKDKIYLLYYGGRDLQTTNAAYLWPILSNCMASAKSQGYIVPVFTQLPQGGTNDVERLEYNRLAALHWPHCGTFLVDLQSLPFTSSTDYTNTIYYGPDTSNGYVPGPFMSTIVEAFLQKLMKPFLSTDIVIK
jgi:hypothetical protein